MGRKTYDWVMKQVTEFPHADKPTYIITRTERPALDNLHFYTGNLQTLVDELKTQPGKHIFCDGGAEIVHELLLHNLVDELIISVIPVLLGNGTRLFKDQRPELDLQLVSVQSYNTGLVQMHYKKLTW
jgi:dihydrofolate reductase